MKWGGFWNSDLLQSVVAFKIVTNSKASCQQKPTRGSGGGNDLKKQQHIL